MASLLKQVFILGLLIFLELPSHVSGEVTVYGLLSLSIFEIKTDIENIKRRIENLEKKVEGTCISTTVSPQFEGRAIKEEEIMDIKDAMNKQALAIKKTLTAEKLILRETVETFESKFADFESKIQKEIGSINASLEDKAGMMLDRINSSASALANSMAELESDFNFTNNDIRQTLETMETSMMSKFGDIETLMIANITMIQKQNELDANRSAVALTTGIAGLTSDLNYTLNEMGELFKTMEETMESNMSAFENKMIDIVEEKQNATQSTLNTLQANLNSLDSTVSSTVYNQTRFLEPKLRSLSSHVSSVRTSLSSGISSLSERMYKQENITQSTLSSLKANLNALDSTVSSISYNQTNIIKPELRSLSSQISSVSTSLSSGISLLSERIYQLEATITDVTQNALSSLKNNLKSLDSTVSSNSYNQTHFVEPELRALSSQISSFSASLSSRISSLESSSRYVAFHAYNLRNWYPREGEIVVFQNVYLNAGGGYDTTNGIFRAPVYGLYHFTAHFCHDTGKYNVFAIYVGEKMIARSTLADSLHSTCGSVTAVTMMDMGQTVTMRANYHNNQLTADYHRQPSFIGVLIRA